MSNVVSIRPLPPAPPSDAPIAQQEPVSATMPSPLRGGVLSRLPGLFQRRHRRYIMTLSHLEQMARYADLAATAEQFAEFVTDFFAYARTLHLYVFTPLESMIRGDRLAAAEVNAARAQLQAAAAKVTATATHFGSLSASEWRSQAWLTELSSIRGWLLPTFRRSEALLMQAALEQWGTAMAGRARADHAGR